MHPLLSAILLAVVAAALSWLLVGLYGRVMTASRHLATPNERSMHSMPVPVGGGIAIVAIALVLWPLWLGAASRPHAVLLMCLAGLGALSWINDRLELSPAVRLTAQAVAVALCLASLAPDAQLVPTVPAAAERIILGLAWLWFINLFNFMDGIDGLAGSEAVAVALGYLLLLTFAGLDGPLWQLALIIAASSVGYLFWNWHPARVFMGDAGSIPLGFLLGWLMLDLALRGYWVAALILPLYFAADATATLFRRTLRGEKPWQAHREHFYQRAVLGGATPPGVVCRVGATNAVLMALALVSVTYPLPALAAAAVVVAALLLRLQSLAGARAHQEPRGAPSMDA
jgi:UDP-N-acetylmuramyl pentapeptide phosphotransferase/UDP-N-acetylglucosamine-1-phosphate transferase